MKCPKCGSEMKAVMFTVKYGSHKARACINLESQPINQKSQLRFHLRMHLSSVTTKRR